MSDRDDNNAFSSSPPSSTPPVRSRPVDPYLLPRPRTSEPSVLVGGTSWAESRDNEHGSSSNNDFLAKFSPAPTNPVVLLAYALSMLWPLLTIVTSRRVLASDGSGAVLWRPNAVPFAVSAGAIVVAIIGEILVARSRGTMSGKVRARVAIVIALIGLGVDTLFLRGIVHAPAHHFAANAQTLGFGVVGLVAVSTPFVILFGTPNARPSDWVSSAYGSTGGLMHGPRSELRRAKALVYVVTHYPFLAIAAVTGFELAQRAHAGLF